LIIFFVFVVGKEKQRVCDDCARKPLTTMEVAIGPRIAAGSKFSLLLLLLFLLVFIIMTTDVDDLI
jgi:hypothetical protein